MSDDKYEDLNAEALGDPSTVRLASSFYRFSSYLDSVVTHRVGVLFENGQYCSYRQSKAKGLKKGSKLCVLSKGCSISQVKQQQVRVRGNDALSTVMFGEVRNLFIFKIKLPDGRELKVGFGSNQKATEWRDNFEDFINTKAPEAQQANSLNKQSNFNDSEVEKDVASQASISPRKGNSRGYNPQSQELSSKRQPSNQSYSLSQDKSNYSQQDLKNRKNNKNKDSKEEDPENFDECESVDFLDNISLPDKEDLNDINMFQSLNQLKVLNGVTIYKENWESLPNSQTQQPEVYVVATPIRVSPKDCFKTFIYRVDQSDQYNYANQWIQQHVLKRRSRKEEPEIVYLLFEPPNSLENYRFSPRYAIAYQNFTLGDEEEYIVRYSSVEQDVESQLELPEWHKNYFVKVQLNMVFNVSPITSSIRQEKTNPSSHDLQNHQVNLSDKNWVVLNQECYLSLVLSIESFGGYFDYKKYLGSWVKYSEQLWIEDLLMSVVYLRNKLEQRRFKIARQIFDKAQPFKDQGQDDMQTRFISFNQKSKEYQKLQNQNSVKKSQEPRINEEDPEALEQQNSSMTEEHKQQLDDNNVVFSRIPAKYFESPGFVSFRVRGKSYLKDKKKVPAGYPIFDLVGLELIKMDKATDHYARFIPWIQQNKTSRFLFIVSLTIPLGGKILGFVVAFGSNIDFANLDDEEEEGNEMSPVDLCMARFLDGDDDAAYQRRCRKLKLIPSIPEGSWFIKNLVGQTPVILGTKLKSSFHRGPGYIESTIDVSTNATAANVTNIVSGAAKAIVMDMAILLEGHSEDELPEAILGIVRLKNLDWNMAYPVDTSQEISSEPREKWLQSQNYGRTSNYGGGSTAPESTFNHDSEASQKINQKDA